MSSALLALRNVVSNQQQINTTALTLNSTQVTLGQNASSTKVNFSNGSYAAGDWRTPTLPSQVATKSAKMSSTGQYQLVVTATTVYLSSDSGVTWSTLGAGNGLSSSGNAIWQSGSISASGQYIVLADSNGGYLYLSRDYGVSFNSGTPAGVSPAVWLKLNGDTTNSGTVVITPTIQGSITYSSTTPVVPGTQYAVFANTAGGSSASGNYLRGTWTGSPNFTVSFWMNPQTLNSTYQNVFSAYGGGSKITIANNNTLYAIVPSGSGSNIVNLGFSPVLMTNTWYYVTLIFQSNNTCSFYLNNNLIGSTINRDGVGSFTTSLFSLGTYDTATTESFNGYIDDFKLYNSAMTYQPVPVIPPAVWLKFEGNTTDSGTNAITPVVTGSMSYIGGPAGKYAVNINNAASVGLTANNYVRFTIPNLTSFAVSGWFNLQSLPTSGNGSAIWSIGSPTQTWVHMMYGNNIQLGSTSYSGFIVFIYNSSSTAVVYTSGNTLETNTWNNFAMSYSTIGTCEIYLNNIRIASAAGQSLLNTSSTFSVGAYCHTNTAGSFNGYIDDLKIYNTAVPFNPMISMNYLQSAVSGSGQYLLASAQSGHLIHSADYGVTWSAKGQLAGSGQMTVTPNKNGLSGSAWTTNGINWTVSASSTYTGCDPFYPFSGFFPYGYWATSSNLYTPSGNSSGINTTFYTNGATTATVQGDWLQLTSSVPLVLSSYQFGVSNPNNTPKTYYILGSNDGTTWYGIQYASATSQPGSTNFVMLAGTIVVNSNSTQTWGPTTLTTTTYTGTANAYTYFRFLVTSVFYSPNTVAQIGTWIPSFVPSTASNLAGGGALALSHSGQYALATVGNAAGSVMPNMTGLTANMWTQGGVVWTASASTQIDGNHPPYKLFENNHTTTAVNRWVPASNTYTTVTGIYAGLLSTAIQTIGAVLGEWVQLSSSVPLVLSTYALATGFYHTNFPKIYYIVGSNDGSIWFPIHYADITTTPFTAGGTVCTYITVNQTGTQSPYSGQSGSITTTSYTTSTQSYTHFRFIFNKALATNNTIIEIGELYLNFQPAAAVSTNFGSTWTGLAGASMTDNVLALSGSGQYALGTSNVVPFSRLTMDNTAADSQGGLTPGTGLGSVTYSSSAVKVGTHSAQFIHSAGQAPSVYLRYTVPTLIYMPTTLTVSLWIYPTANPTTGLSIPFAFSDGTSSSNQFYINSSGALKYSWYTTTSSSGDIGTTNISLNTWSHLAITFNAGNFIFYVNGVVSATTSSTGNMCVYGNVNMTNIFIGSNTPGYNAFEGYVDDVRIYTAVLSASQIAGMYNNPTIGTQSISIASNYLSSSAITTNPTFPSINAPLVAAATSFNGQQMVAVTSGTTNNVYYSTNYGVTWSNLTLGSAAMIGCTMSSDGSYVTVTSATATYTLNLNSTGYHLAIGNQAGQTNQGQHAIAIGNKAGQTNQTANSIVLNATGLAVAAPQSGFYVAPVAQYQSTASNMITLLGYGDDKQIVQTGIGLSASTGNITTTKSITTANYTWMNWNSNICNVPWPATVMYYKIATLGSTSAGVNHGAVTIKGTLGGWVNATSPLMYVDIVFSTRGSVTVNGTVQSSNIPNAQAYMDLQYIINSAGQYDVYLAVKGGYVSFDIMVGGNMGSPDSVLIYDPTVTTYTSVVPGTMTSLTSMCQMYVSSGGNVGIGTSTPSAALTIYKSDVAYHRLTSLYINTPQAGIVLDSTQTASGRKWNLFANTAGSTCTDGSLAILDIAAGAYRMVIDPTGNVGIGITNPSYTLHVGGTIYATGDISAFSDQRYKTRVTPLPSPLDTVTQLRGVSYYRTDEEPDKKRIGFLAQQVKEVYPEAVNYDAANDKYSVSYISLVAPLVEALKELKAKHDALSAWATANGYKG